MRRCPRLNLYPRCDTFRHMLRCLLLGWAIMHTAYATDPNKVLHTYFPVAETGFDPVASTDVYSSIIEHSIFEALYSYDYLARPVKLQPLTATALPTISADGKTYTIHIKKGIYFQDDPAFKGQKRELTAYDYAYSIKRLLNPLLASPSAWLLEGKFKGMESLIAAAKKNRRFDYDAAVEGIQTPDRYTLVLKLNQLDYNLPMRLAHTPTVAVAREVIEKYQDARGFVMAHPVGTGAYRLSKWIPGSRIILSANPHYRGYIWDFKAGTDAIDHSIIRQMKGKKMPQIGTVEIQIIEDGASCWLSFKQKRLDWIELDRQNYNLAIENGQLKPELAQLGIRRSVTNQIERIDVLWNMQDPLVGGTAPEKIALRRAVFMAFSRENYNRLVYNGFAIPGSFPAPPGVAGYDANFKTAIPHSVAAANLLLDRYHYSIGPDGYRRQPNGQALSIEYATYTSTDHIPAEYWKRLFDQLHIRLTVKTMLFPDYLKAQRNCTLQFNMQAWVADYPDADNFFQLFYSPTAHTPSNYCNNLSAYNQRYARSVTMMDRPERTRLYQEMARILENYSIALPIFSRPNDILLQPKVQGFKSNPMKIPYWLYVDIEK